MLAVAAERWAAPARFGELKLALGEVDEALPVLEQAAAAQPLDEAARAGFPDGQLYINLRGYGEEQPVPPADALARFLRAPGVSGQDVPPGRRRAGGPLPQPARRPPH